MKRHKLAKLELRILEALWARGKDAHGWRMVNLSDVLSTHLNRRVIDKTGIAEAFDFHLDLPVPPPPGSPGIDDPDKPEVFGTVMDAVQSLV